MQKQGMFEYINSLNIQEANEVAKDVHIKEVHH